MYEERRNVFDWKGFLLKLIIILLLIFVVYQLFAGVKTNTLYDQIYNDNLTTMKEAATNYFTTDRLPENIGEEKTMTLQDMLNNKLLVEFVDKDGKSCDTFGSYVTVTKVESDKYTLKVQLACGDHIDYILDTIGCHDVCTNNCKEQIIEYEFKKATTITDKVKGCKSGYKLSGNTCYKVIKSDYIKATKEYYDEKTVVTDSKISTGNSYKIYTDKIVGSDKNYANNISEVKCADSTYTLNNEKTICSKTVQTIVNNPQICTWVVTGTRVVDSCDGCAIVIQPTYKEVCRSGGTSTVTDTLTATPVTTYSCPTGYTEEGDNTLSTLKCYKAVTAYSCPTGFSSEGSDTNLVCYKVIPGNNTEYCPDFGANLIDHKCYKVVDGGFKGYSCPTGYLSDGSKCYKKSTDKTSTIMVNKTTTTYEYKWSTETEIAGWTRTGKTRLVDETTTEDSEEIINDIKKDSDKEVSERVNNVSNNKIDKTDIIYIVIASIVVLGFIYLFIMFLSTRRSPKNK